MQDFKFFWRGLLLLLPQILYDVGFALFTAQREDLVNSEGLTQVRGLRRMFADFPNNIDITSLLFGLSLAGIFMLIWDNTIGKRSYTIQKKEFEKSGFELATKIKNQDEYISHLNSIINPLKEENKSLKSDVKEHILKYKDLTENSRFDFRFEGLAKVRNPSLTLAAKRPADNMSNPCFIMVHISVWNIGEPTRIKNWSLLVKEGINGKQVEGFPRNLNIQGETLEKIPERLRPKLTGLNEMAFEKEVDKNPIRSTVTFLTDLTDDEYLHEDTIMEVVLTDFNNKQVSRMIDMQNNRL